MEHFEISFHDALYIQIIFKKMHPSLIKFYDFFQNMLYKDKNSI